MRYLKLYEESSNDNYEEIDVRSYGDIVGHSMNYLYNDYKDSFTRNEFISIRSLLKKNTKWELNGSARYVSRELISMHTPFDDKNYIDIYINKVKDEWYYAKVSFHEINKWKWKYYKCDQFDGLISFLNYMFDTYTN